MCKKLKKPEKETNNYHFVIESTVFKIFMTFSGAAIAISALYTVVDLLYYQMLY